MKKVFLLGFIILLLIPFASAFSFSDLFNGLFGITGKVTDNPGKAIILHRTVKNCATGEAISEKQVFDLRTFRSGKYTNYKCKSRYKEQCDPRNPDDTYYDEWCEYEKISIPIPDTKKPMCYTRIRGDLNNDNKVDMSDAILMSKIKKLPKGETCCIDLNGDGKKSISDLVRLVGLRGKEERCEERFFDSGLIIIKEGVSGKDYAKKIATERGWDFITTASSNVDIIRNQINQYYNNKNFHYLLLIGTNEEIPFAKENWNENRFQGYETDPSLYADINNDGFIELSIGRIPFSSEEKLRTYFTDLKPKGNNYYFEHFRFNTDIDDPLDGFTVRDYNYAQCLKSYIPSIKVYKNTDFSDLINHYKTATILELRTHGTDSVGCIDNLFNVFSIKSLCNNCQKRESFDDPYCDCEKPEYLSNRPILIHLSCNNARQLGIELIENGASAIVSFYNPSGGVPPIFSQYLFEGKSIGDSFREIYNKQIIKTFGIKIEQGYGSIIPNIEGLNNFDLKESNKPFDFDGFMLYGDPSLKLSNPPFFDPSISIEQKDNKIIINIKKTTLYDMTEKDSLLCYTGTTVYNPSFVNKDNWGETTNFGNSHFVSLNFPVKNINEILKTIAVIDNEEIDLSVGAYKEYRVSLIKGISKQYVCLMIQDPQLNFNKDIKIIIEYSEDKQTPNEENTLNEKTNVEEPEEVIPIIADKESSQTKEIKCTDSDVTDRFPDGKNYYVKGTCYDEGYPDGISDRCDDTPGSEDHVEDFICYTETEGLNKGHTYCVGHSFKCLNGCNDGACIP